VVVFQAHNHPKRVGLAVQITGAEKPYVPPKSRNFKLVAFEAEASR
jgi:hypothetical protein